jgi:hypothetical protein
MDWRNPLATARPLNDPPEGAAYRVDGVGYTGMASLMPKREYLRQCTVRIAVFGLFWWCGPLFFPVPALLSPC